MHLTRILSICLLSVFTTSIFAQNDKTVYKEKKDGFYQNTIQKEIKEFENSDQDTNPETYLSLDFTHKEITNSCSFADSSAEEGDWQDLGCLQLIRHRA